MLYNDDIRYIVILNWQFLQYKSEKTVILKNIQLFWQRQWGVGGGGSGGDDDGGSGLGGGGGSGGCVGCGSGGGGGGSGIGGNNVSFIVSLIFL